MGEGNPSDRGSPQPSDTNPQLSGTGRPGDQETADDTLHLPEFESGLLIGVLIGEGSFGGDGRHASITVRMHIRHETLFRLLTVIVPGSRLYGPYNHSGRSYYQWLVRGRALRHLIPFLDTRLTEEVDGHAWERYQRMKRTYRL